MLKIGIVGLPNAGKSTLFNALVEKPQARTEPRPFTTIEKNAGVVNVPDETLVELAKLHNIGKVTYAQVEFVDIAGLIKGAHQGEGLGNEFLGHIKEVDLILHVLRYFKDERVPHVHPKIDPEEDYAIVNQELILKDMETIERRMKRKRVAPEEKEFLKKLLGYLDKGKFARDYPFSEKEREWVKALFLLTLKPQVVVGNIGEEDIGKDLGRVNGEEVIPVCARLEAELSALPWTEKRAFMKEVGLKESAKRKLIRICYERLGLITFYTVAKGREARAWSVEEGTTIWEAAGKIHSDFQKHFVKAFVIKASELFNIGPFQKAVEKGKVKVVGRDYVVEEGDVIEVKVGK